MQNKNKIILKQLNGSIEAIEKIPALLEESNLYTEAGFVDCDFLTGILDYMQRNAKVAAAISKSLNQMLGGDDIVEKQEKEETGEEWTVEQILKSCSFNGELLTLPNVKLNRKSYQEAKKWIEDAGGVWNIQKQGFTFDFNAERVCSILLQGKRCNLQQEFQYFSTPAMLAEKLCAKISNITTAMNVLEPSAGRGVLIKAIHRKYPDVVVDCYELMPENLQFLKNMQNVRIKGDDFMTCKTTYDIIIANPPFAKNQDIKHTMKMYELLNQNGEMAVITSQHWKFASEKECVSFREWLKEVGAEIEDIDKGIFRESGTNTATSLIYINK